MNTLLKLTIPRKIDYSFINTGMKDYDKTRQQITQIMEDPSMNSITPTFMAQLKGYGDSLNDQLMRGQLPRRTPVLSMLGSMTSTMKPTVPSQNRVFLNSKFPTSRNITLNAFRVPGMDI